MFVRAIGQPAFRPEQSLPDLEFASHAEVYAHVQKGARVECQIRAPFFFLKELRRSGFVNPGACVFQNMVLNEGEILFFNDKNELSFMLPKGTPFVAVADHATRVPAITESGATNQKAETLLVQPNGCLADGATPRRTTCKPKP